jgi:hypothetical protein
VKLYYIVQPGAMKGFRCAWHGQELGDKRMLVVIRWTDEAQELAFSQRPEVEALPHPLFEPNQPLKDDHIAALATRHAVKQGDTIHDLIKIASKQFVAFRLHVL